MVGWFMSRAGLPAVRTAPAREQNVTRRRAMNQ